MATALDKLASLRKSGKKLSISEAQAWFKSVLKDGDAKTNKILPGQVITFAYDAKLKDTLPYWDKQPMGIVVDVQSNGFQMINLHYLPASLRLDLLEALLIKTRGKGEKKRVAISYDLLKGAAKYKFFKACFKKYLGGHLKSRMILIPETEWEYAIQMPTAKFTGAARQAIYKQSIKIGKS